MVFNGPIYIHTFLLNGKPADLKQRLAMRKHCGPYQWTPCEPGKGRGFYTKESHGKPTCGDSTFGEDERIAEEDRANEEDSEVIQ